MDKIGGLLEILASKPHEIDPTEFYDILKLFNSTNQQDLLLVTFLTKACLDFALKNLYNFSVDEIFKIIWNNVCLYHIPYQLHLERYLEATTNEETYKIITDFKNRAQK
ncbi:hypothetical protein TVAG_234140 [Trichomonas vaginalis G3]|uniref:Uncharacterized protein n=1 Tax=Trichomonas vaginalis (strain ATCC PRA-98 / G3) TaxID=412133 RepID=A2FXP2_TRIV3|nr:hypothetical protein TVAGG3_0164800 [Trichomonas vaginalis G3]EAX90321.1 hypothetical protein TVAG_234140 [Trichomonas vaginalis G3]KAI5548138.1 hypothetical protein TVAGG3_0164800 [Trichomonas vaginalis G3]|eukprot:XP_001303251.1 hypothetical protein [Trichomonas vaginalis G3]